MSNRSDRSWNVWRRAQLWYTQPSGRCWKHAYCDAVRRKGEAAPKMNADRARTGVCPRASRSLELILNVPNRDQVESRSLRFSQHPRSLPASPFLTLSRLRRPASRSSPLALLFLHRRPRTTLNRLNEPSTIGTRCFPLSLAHLPAGGGSPKLKGASKDRAIRDRRCSWHFVTTADSYNPTEHPRAK